MEYRSQKIAYWYFAVALLLFTLQVVLGLWLAFNYTFTVPQGIVDVFSFATARAMHTNLLVLWMLLGFMGGTYFIVPEETKSEIYSTKLAWFQLVALVVTGVVALIGFAFGWTRDGRFLRYRRRLILSWSSARSSFCSMWDDHVPGEAMDRDPGHAPRRAALPRAPVPFRDPFYQNEVIDWYYWWWVIHLWVEGAWELVTAAISRSS